MANGLVVKYSPDEKVGFLSFIKENFGKISFREMARRLHIGNTTICKWAKELGLYVKQDTVNENYFKTWTPDMAYILGFIFADGNIAWNPEKAYRALTITVAAKDKVHLEKMRILLESTKPLFYSDLTNSYRLIINNKKVCIDLMNLGVVPRKSLIKEFPDIPIDYICDFIRGYVDGNGTVRYTDRKRSSYFEISICCGSIRFLEKLVEVVETNIGIKINIIHSKENVYTARYTCTKGMQFAKWIYNNHDLCLLRKYNNYQIALNNKGIKGEN